MPGHTLGPDVGTAASETRKGANKSFRQYLVGTVSLFLQQEVMFCEHTQDGLVDAVVSLARYREEGTPLYPKLVVCDSLSETVKQVGGSDPIELGSGPRDSRTLRDALKKCAPLARDNWIAFVERTPAKFRFGVFRQNVSPTALAARDTIDCSRSGVTEKNTGLIYITQVAENVVELVGSRGPSLTIHLNAVPEETAGFSSQGTLRLSNAIIRVPDTKLKQRCVSFIHNLLVDSFRSGHGALVAVVEPDRAAPKRLVQDSVKLAQPIDIVRAVREHMAQPSEDTFGRLSDYKNVVTGMLSSDGVTIFTSEGVVTHFRVFLQLSKSNGGNGKPTGGARRRAFQELTAMVNQGVVRATFIRSSDGASEFVARDQ